MKTKQTKKIKQLVKIMEMIIGNEFSENVVSGVCDCICYFGGGIYVDSTAFPIIGSSETLGNTFFENYGDYGFDLFRSPPIDTTDWTPIFAHHNTFEDCLLVILIMFFHRMAGIWKIATHYYLLTKISM